MTRAAGAVLAAWVLLHPLAADATVSAGCRVPEIFLTFDNDLGRTERLIDRSQPVSILFIGPLPDRLALSDKKRSRLEVELSRRLPDIAFTIVDEGATQGLARDDFSRIRAAVERVSPDLIIWQVGTADALAATNPASFARTLERAADWLRGRSIDLVLIDPPFVPGVDHEHLYGRIVKQIDAVSDKGRVNVVQQYGATSYLQSATRATAAGGPAGGGAASGGPTGGGPVGGGAAGGRGCMSELVAEAIVNAVTR